MEKKLFYTGFFVCLLVFSTLKSQNLIPTPYHEQHRLQVHFSPKQHWINDPNGMVFFNGVYHLFFQYNPGASVWGPMHWGHAESKDLIHWKELPIALYPDSLGTIFSGSAVVDLNNTAGFGKNGKIALVAIFTQHNQTGADKNRNDFQNQSIAYSTDNGNAWTKFSGNPVLKNPGIIDFRDPKVLWYAPQKKWIMTLATKDHITFYSSSDLKQWNRESEFGNDAGAHGGVWECPDLISFDDKGKKIWALIVNLNPGGPNKGSATQYFIGDFDGHQFTSIFNTVKWIDYGPDEYAGITWSNTGKRKIFLGWMTNWIYANQVPTEIWRNAMTVPRELKLKHVANDILITSQPVKELYGIESNSVVMKNIPVMQDLVLSKKIQHLKFPCRLDISTDELDDFSVVLFNNLGEEIVVGYDKTANQFYIDRTKSSKTKFHDEFAAIHVAPRFIRTTSSILTLLIDVSSVELFADDGLTVMTEIFFPTKDYEDIKIKTPGKFSVKRLRYAELKSIWN